MNCLVSTPTAAPITSGRYQIRLAQNAGDIIAAQRLRFEVFNGDLNLGLDTSYLSGLDRDRFEAACDHLLIEEVRSGAVIATCRLQTGQLAALNLGFCHARRFDFSPYEAIRFETVEVSRACLHIEHRERSVLNLLWRAIVLYSTARRARYLLGCSAHPSQNAGLGLAMYASLGEEFLAPDRFRTKPRPAYSSIPTEGLVPGDVPMALPHLLRAFLAVGAKVCGPPALDPEFKTIDFLTILDLESLTEAARQNLLGCAPLGGE
jgi:putative hemolysin